jgi:hypothetical protein
VADKPNASQYLNEGAEIYKKQGALYGNNYQTFGSVFMALFPEGIKVDNAADASRLGVLIQITNKLTRYAKNFNRGGHHDSLIDMSVYSAMLAEIDELARQESSARPPTTRPPFTRTTTSANGG